MIQKFIRGQRQPWWYSIVAILISAMLLGFTSLYLSKRAEITAHREARKSEQQWCELLVTLDNIYQKKQPETQAAQQFAAEIHRLKVKFGC